MLSYHRTCSIFIKFSLRLSVEDGQAELAWMAYCYLWMFCLQGGTSQYILTVVNNKSYTVSSAKSANYCIS